MSKRASSTLSTNTIVVIVLLAIFVAVAGGAAAYYYFFVHRPKKQQEEKEKNKHFEQTDKDFARLKELGWAMKRDRKNGGVLYYNKSNEKETVKKLKEIPEWTQKPQPPYNELWDIAKDADGIPVYVKQIGRGWARTYNVEETRM